MTDKKEVENMKEFMTILMEVKVSLAEQNAKLDNLLDIKQKVEKLNDTASEALKLSEQNCKDIVDIKKDVDDKASKEDIERIVKQRENSFKNTPSYISLGISILTVIILLITTIMNAGG